MTTPVAVKVEGRSTYSDPLLPSYYWHLGDATGAVKGGNAMRVWDDYRGSGVIVAVIDDGVEYTHPDLAANYRGDLDYDTRDLDADPFPGEASDRHGTAVSGVIAAALNNGIGGAGVAPEASLAGYRIGFGANGTLEQLLAAFQLLTAVDVANNSWGFDGYFGDNFLDPEFAPIGDALAAALAAGRGGLGTVVVIAAGNARTSGQDVNYHGFQNHRGTIAVAATDSAGNVTYYSTPGAALLVSAPGHGITTTDRVDGEGYGSCDYATVNGTSFAAPMVSGIAALMLDANPHLGWRDVQEILAATAVRTGSAASWSLNGADNWNGGGMHVSHDYGFGLVDAYAAVRVAESWRSVSTSVNEWVADGLQYPASPIAIPDGGSVASTITLTSGLRIDRVEVDLALVHPYLGQLRVTLTAPDGTESVLVHNPSASQGNIYFTFSTTRDWGEMSGGNWTLTVSDRQLGATGVVYAWGIRAYGDPAGDETYLYTSEFAALAAADPSRRVLSDAGGTDTINTAAIAGDTLLDLRPGSVSLITGLELTIAAGTVIENADSGDGNDTLIGNDAANSLRGWRGDDFLDGGAGADTLDGGVGNDVYVVDSAGDAVVELTGSGADTVRTTLATCALGTDLENLVFIGAGNFAGTGNAATNAIDGGPGNDSLNGGTGADVLRGGAGDDSYTVDNPGDSVVELAGKGSDTVYSPIDWTLGAQVERLILTGSAAVSGTGNELANTLMGQGNGAANRLVGGLGDDSYYVGVNDTVVEAAGEGSDIVYSSMNWTLVVNIERLYLTGGDAVIGTGNDLANGLHGQANAAPNTLIGGLGNDTYYVGSNDITVELAGQGTDTAYSYGDYLLAAGVSVENLYLNVTTGQALTGNELANNLRGNNGTDTLNGLEGNDSLNGGLGADLLRGGPGDDSYTVDHPGDSVAEVAGEGNDVVYSSVTWTLAAHLERLTLTGSEVIGATGNDLANSLSGQSNPAANILAGGLGDDSYYVGLNDHIVEAAGEGNDIVYSSMSWTLGANVERLYLTGGDAVIATGNELANGLYGLANAAANTLIGGLGNDTYYVGSNDIIVEPGGQGTDTAYAYGDYLLAADVSAENLYLNVTTGQTLTGNELANNLRGNNGTDTLNGLEGNDSLSGGLGADLLRGGRGDDSYTVDHPGDNAVELAGEGNDVVYSSVTWTLAANLERLILTGGGAISGTGNELANTLMGQGNGAANTLVGGLGDDSYYVGVNDTVVEAAGEGSDIVYSSMNWTLAVNVERLYLTGGDAVIGTGNDLANGLHGQANAAPNTLIGGLGNDTYYVGSNDITVELAGQGTDTAYSYGDYLLAAGVSVENLYLNVTTGQTLTGNELANNLRGNNGSDTLNGLQGNDSLNGGLGADVLDGGQANDTLVGGLGNDTLTGGDGNDLFRFDTAPDATGNRDSVLDFNVIDDGFQLENAIFTALTPTGTLAAGSFVIGAAAIDANDYLIYDRTTGGLFYDADGSGSGASVQFAVLSTSLALTNLDFVVT